MQGIWDSFVGYLDPSVQKTPGEYGDPIWALERSAPISG